MNVILKLLALVYLVIWIAIGAIVLFAIIAVVPAKPWQMMSGAGGGFPFSMGGQMPSQMQEGFAKAASEFKDPAKREEAWQNLSKSQQECMIAAVGEATVQKFRTDPKFSFDAALLVKASPCLSK